MKKLIVICLLISVFLVQCYTPSEFVRDENCVESNNSICFVTNAQLLKPIGNSTLKKTADNNYSTKGPQVKSNVDYEVILGIFIGGGLGYLAAPKYKLFNHSIAPNGLKYTLSGALIGGIGGYLISKDD